MKALVRDIAEGTRDRGRLAARAATAWRAVRRRRLTRIIASAMVMAMAAVLALALLPGITASASVALRTPVELRQVTGMAIAHPCPPGSVPEESPDFGVCFTLTRTGMVITTVQSAVVQKQATHAAKQKLPLPAFAYWVVIRFMPSGAAQFLTLTRDIYRLPYPRDELAIIVRGKLLGFSVIKKAGTEGTFEILFFSHSAAENLLNELLHG